MTDTPVASPDPSTPPPGTMRRDIASAYALTAARVGSWVLVSAAVYRTLGADAFGVVALVRATIGLVGYVSLGIGPAMVRLLSLAEHEPSADDAHSNAAVPLNHLSEPATTTVLAYAADGEPPAPDERVARVYVTGERLTIAFGLVALMLGGIYAIAYDGLHELPVGFTAQTRGLAFFFALGVAFRVISEAPAGLLQVRHRIALDNALSAGAETAWGIASAATVFAVGADAEIAVVGAWFAAANFALWIARSVAGRLAARSLTGRAATFDPTAARRLVAFGVLVVLAQLGDFLYAPVDYILINRLISPEAVAVYAPAVQVDAALLLSVTAVAAVLLPKAAMAHAAGDVASVRRYYVRGTLATGAMLAAGAVVVWALSPWAFRLWLGEPMEATRALLPLVLVHTVVGGSGAVGRSILLGMGKVRPFTISVLLAGVGNVVLSYLFVRMGLGLKGIVLGTIVVVTLRAGVWMPWYVMRVLKEEGGKTSGEANIERSTLNVQR